MKTCTVSVYAAYPVFSGIVPMIMCYSATLYQLASLTKDIHTPLQAIFHGKTSQRSPRYNNGMLSHHQRIRELTLRKLNILETYSHIPLWFNSRMPKLLTFPDPVIWANNGILYLHQVMTPSGPKTFQTLKEEFSFPNHLFFRYLQL